MCFFWQHHPQRHTCWMDFMNDHLICYECVLRNVRQTKPRLWGMLDEVEI